LHCRQMVSHLPAMQAAAVEYSVYAGVFYCFFGG
jgi:hypothetical protein